MNVDPDPTTDDLPWAAPACPSRNVSDAIRRECTRDLCKKRGMPAGRRLMLSMLISAGVFGVLYYLALDRNEPAGAMRSAMYGAAGWGIVQAAVLFVGLARPPGKRVSRTWRLVIAIGVPVLFLAWLTYNDTSRLPIASFLHGSPAAHAIGCGLHSLLFGAIAAGGMLLVWRGTDPLTPGLSGALAGLAGGLAGAAAIGVACPAGEAWHLWVAHGFTVVAMAGLGFFAGRRWLAP